MMKRILFVCTGNACRSPAAEALFKQAVPDLIIDSAGTHPHYEITEMTRTYLREHHADHLVKAFPESVDSKNLEAFDLIIAMEANHRNFLLHRCPQCITKIEVWNIPDPYYLDSEHAAHAYNKLKQKVLHLARVIHH